MTMIPAILSDGVGAELWSISRAHDLKPFSGLSYHMSSLGKISVRALQSQNANRAIRLTYKKYYVKSQNEYPVVNIASLTTSLSHQAFNQNTVPANTLATPEIMKPFEADTQTLVLPEDSLGPVQEFFVPTTTKAMRLNYGDISLLFDNTQTSTLAEYV